MFPYLLASLTPAVLIAVGALFGGVWPFVALVAMTLWVALVDRLVALNIPAREEARGALALPVILAGAHFILAVLVVWAVFHAQWLGPAQAVALALTLGLFMGQVSNSNAHELIHRPQRWARRLGAAVYASMLFGHHASAHLLVHHVAVASEGDPNSARLGEGFYHFWPRAWLGSLREGWRQERRRRKGLHPYLGYGAGALLALVVAFVLAGAGGVALWLGLSIHAQMQLFLSDYVQHYGLSRARLPDGRLEPVGVKHSWNAAPWYSAAMMLNAPRHSDHHVNPRRQFPALRLEPQTMPMLPYAFPVMATIALFPSLWRRVMDPRVAGWRTQNGGAPAQALAGSAHNENRNDSSVPAGSPAFGAIHDERRSI